MILWYIMYHDHLHIYWFSTNTDTICDGSQHVVYMKPLGIHWVTLIFWIGTRSVEYSQILRQISAWYPLFFTQFYYYLSKCNTDTQHVHYNHNLIIIERKTHVNECHGMEQWTFIYLKPCLIIHSLKTWRKRTKQQPANTQTNNYHQYHILPAIHHCTDKE